MDDLISRKALLAEYDRVHIGEPGKARKLMEDAPGVDAVPVVHGRWIGVDSSYWRWAHDGGHTVEHITFRCSECARKSIIKTNYCPNCGAKMDGERKDND